MPGFTIQNDTSETLHVAFGFVAPIFMANQLQPGETRRGNLSTWPHTVEVRKDIPHSEMGLVYSTEFSAQESWATFGDIAGGWAAGAGAVLLGGLGLFSASTPAAEIAVPGSIAGAGALLSHACAAGKRFAIGKDGVVLSIQGVMIPFHDRHFALREVDGRLSLWDVDESRMLG